MIHNAYASFTTPIDLSGDDAEFLAKHIAENNLTMARIYAQKTGKSVEEIAEAMKKETVLKGSEAVEFGLCDSLIDGGELINPFTKAEVIAMAKEVKKDTEIKKEEVTEPTKPVTPEAKKEDIIEKADKASNEMNELQAEFDRCKDLDALMAKAKIPFDVIYKAKYEDKKTAGELAVELLIEQAQKAEAKPEEPNTDLIKDLLESGTSEVGSAPNDPIQGNNKKPDYDWKQVAELMK